MNEVNRGEGRRGIGIVAIFISSSLLLLALRIGKQFNFLITHKQQVGNSEEDSGQTYGDSNNSSFHEMVPLLFEEENEFSDEQNKSFNIDHKMSSNGDDDVNKRKDEVII